LKWRAHNLFSCGVVALIMHWTPVGFIAAIFANVAIDLLGHTWQGRWRRRTPYTHSILTAPLVGVIVGALIGEILTAAGIGNWLSAIPLANYVNGVLVIQAMPTSFVSEGAEGGFISAICHLFLDAPTMAGIFVPSRLLEVVKGSSTKVGSL
jgi:hypothetical protein